jgi:putative transposase
MRRTRELRQGARYHIFAKANNRELLLAESTAKELFEQTLIRARQKYVFTVENFVIMNNYYHLIIKPGENENLSRIMQWIMSVFAINFNHRTGRSGHFWAERFFSQILASLQDYRKVFEHINLCPVREGLAAFVWQWRFGAVWHARHGWGHILDSPTAFFSR